MKQSTWMRPILACFAVLVFGVAACNTPTEYEVPMGQHLEIILPSPSQGVDPAAVVEPLVDFCRQWPGTEQVNVAEHQRDDDLITTDLSVWGEHLNGQQLLAALESEFSWLAGAESQLQPLTAVVESNLAERMGHAVLNLDLHGHSAVDIRAQILAQLQEQGYAGDAVVEVLVEDGQETISIEMSGTVHLEDGSGADEQGLTLDIEHKSN